MLNSPAKRELKINQRRILIDSIEIGIPSSEQILTWAERRLPNGKKVGQIKNSKTVNYKKFTPLLDGLFCERIFGPVKSWICACGKKQPHKNMRFCEKCEVEYTDQNVRRYRLGYISLLSSVAHIWYLKGRPSYLSIFLGKRKKTVMALAYCNAYLIEQTFSPIKESTEFKCRQDHGLQVYSKNIKSFTRTQHFALNFYKSSKFKSNQEKVQLRLLPEKDFLSSTHIPPILSGKAQLSTTLKEARIEENNNLSNTTNKFLQKDQRKKVSLVNSFFYLLTQILGDSKNNSVTLINYVHYLRSVKDSNKSIIKRKLATILRKEEEKENEKQFKRSLRLLPNTLVNFRKQAPQINPDKYSKKKNVTLFSTEKLLENYNQSQNIKLKQIPIPKLSRSISKKNTTINPKLFVESFSADGSIDSRFPRHLLPEIFRIHSLGSTVLDTLQPGIRVDEIKPSTRSKQDIVSNYLNLSTQPRQDDIGYVMKRENEQNSDLSSHVSHSSNLSTHIDNSLNPSVLRTSNSSNRTEKKLLCLLGDTPQKVRNFYNRGQTLPFLPTLVCKYNLRDELLNIFNSSPLNEDIPIPLYCETKRWQPLQDVHKFMAEQSFSQFNNLKKEVSPQIKSFLSEEKAFEESSSTKSPLSFQSSGIKQEKLPINSLRRFKTLNFTDRTSRSIAKDNVLPMTAGISLGASSSEDKKFASGKFFNRTAKDPFQFFSERLLNTVYNSLFKKDNQIPTCSTVSSFSTEKNASLSSFLLLPEIKRVVNYFNVVHKESVSEPKKIELKPEVPLKEDALLGNNINNVESLEKKKVNTFENKENSKKSFQKDKNRHTTSLQVQLPNGISQFFRINQLTDVNNFLNQSDTQVSKADLSTQSTSNSSNRSTHVDHSSNLSTHIDNSSNQDSNLTFRLKKHGTDNSIGNAFTQFRMGVAGEARVGRGVGVGNGRRLYPNGISYEGRDFIFDKSIQKRVSSTDNQSDEPRKPGKGKEKELLSQVELTAIREILSYTGGGALKNLLKRFDIQSFSTVLLTDIQMTREAYTSRERAPFAEDLDIKKKILTGLSKRIYRNARRLKIAQLLTRSHRRPEWMMISTLPVLPPDLRPILQMSESLVVASDLNSLYQRVIYRNNRYYKLRLIDFHLVTAMQRLVQDAVDRLIENGKGGSKPFYTPSGRPLKSLSDTLKGKKGRFRLNLLGKRVDFSGRSVIVVSPHLKIHECGLPKEIALKLYTYFLLRHFMLKKEASSIVIAKKIIKQRKSGMWDMLRDIIYYHPLLLNRAPTLHRLGIQAFQPRLVNGSAILLHPLVCSGFNADFDGDQMGVHLPLCFAARAEAWDLLWSRNNILSPATGQPVLVPSQDMVLGFYYMTAFFPTRSLRIQEESLSGKLDSSTNSQRLPSGSLEKGLVRFLDAQYSRVPDIRKLEFSTRIFSHYLDVTRAFQNGYIGLHTPIWLKWDGKVENDSGPEVPLEVRLNTFGSSTHIYSKYKRRNDEQFCYLQPNRENISFSTIYTRTTVGRVLVNEILFSCREIR